MEGAASLTKLWYLKNLDVFSHLAEEDRRRIHEATTMRTVRKGERIYLQGSRADHIHILKRGTVKITKLSPDGKEIILDILKPASLFGALDAGESQEMDESAEMLEDGLICSMTKSRFQELQKTIPGLALRVSKFIGFRLRKIENRLLDIVWSTVEQRLATTLVHLLGDFGVAENGGYLLKIRLTHKDLAALVASSRETVTATLNRLKKDGILASRGKYLVIKNLEKLKEISRSIQF